MQALHVLQNTQLVKQFDFPHPEKVPKQVEHCSENPNFFFIQPATQSATPQQEVPQVFKFTFDSFLLLFQIFLSALLQNPSENAHFNKSLLYVKFNEY
jgi:hypothetical protein